MPEQDQKRSGLQDAASTAHMISGAVKTGKAIAGAAKGAAAGPYGVAAAAAWDSRQHIGKIVLVIVVLLLLPVLFILMLPTLIFGTLFSSGSSSGTSDQPILNDNAAIIENTNDIAFSVSQILGEGIEDVKERISEDFAVASGDQYEIINPYEGDMTTNTNSFIAQYCAANDQEWEDISLSDLEKTLRDNLGELYTFQRVSETRSIPDNPETSEDESGSELWYIYTISYRGESYFADAIFHLTDEQKQLAGDYAQNLSLFLGDGVFQYADSSNTIPSLGDVLFTDSVIEVVYYNQKDERYANAPFGTDDIGRYGCGPTAMAIVVSSLTSDAVDPIEMAEWAYENGYWCSKSGSYHTLIPGAAEEWGLSVEGCTASEPQRIVDALSEGKLVVALMTEGHFTSSGHFIVLRGTQDGNILVADPNSVSRSEKAWDLSIILNEASKRAGAGGPFWIIG